MNWRFGLFCATMFVVGLLATSEIKDKKEK
jgi:hypothetical protein